MEKAARRHTPLENRSVSEGLNESGETGAECSGEKITHLDAESGINRCWCLNQYQDSIRKPAEVQTLPRLILGEAFLFIRHSKWLSNDVICITSKETTADIQANAPMPFSRDLIDCNEILSKCEWLPPDRSLVLIMAAKASFHHRFCQFLPTLAELGGHVVNVAASYDYSEGGQQSLLAGVTPL